MRHSTQSAGLVFVLNSSRTYNITVTPIQTSGPLPNPTPSSLTLFCVVVPFPLSSVPIVPSFIMLSSIVSSLLFPVLLSHDSLFPIPYISTLSCMYLTCSNIDLRNHCLLDSLLLLVIVSSTLNSALRTSELRLTSELRPTS